MIKISLIKSDINTPTDIYIWLVAKEVGKDKLHIRMTFHPTEEICKENMDIKSKDSNMLYSISKLNSDYYIQYPNIFVKNEFRKNYHNMIKERIKEFNNTNNIFSDIEIIL